MLAAFLFCPDWLRDTQGIVQPQTLYRNMESLDTFRASFKVVGNNFNKLENRRISFEAFEPVSKLFGPLQNRLARFKTVQQL